MRCEHEDLMKSGHVKCFAHGLAHSKCPDNVRIIACIAIARAASLSRVRA